MPIDATKFRAALGRFASGVTVVTTRGADGVDHGMTATSFVSVSLNPPLILICIGHDASMAGPIATAEYFAVHILGARQELLSRSFAAEGDRFAGQPVARGSGSIPVLGESLARLECRVYARHPAGDHTVVIGEVLDARLGEDDGPLIYYDRHYGRFQR